MPIKAQRAIHDVDQEGFTLANWILGKLFRCGTMAILDAGDSDILSSEA